MLQCAAVWYSVLLCVAVCYSVLQCVAACCSVLQCVAVCCCEKVDVNGGLVVRDKCFNVLQFVAESQKMLVAS